ncbi:mitochondrial carrier protein CoAc1-like [Rhodamnia argentea]|uniref:Mitochondrial carrier protein CoAc1-like n=1 Tax=Rhodamnia argentea TaxID=178133 RepID=A0A8B8NSD6_9MYRT|nr:mitochondrial carrier protein CoAc1-like [Rhodamnia argentea]
MESSRVGRFMHVWSENGDDCFVDALPVCVRELIAGGAAGAFAKTAVAPLERIKILLQIRTEGFRSIGVYESFKKILRHEGVQGLYKGNGASVIRVVPYAALQYMTYEQYRGWILDNCPSLGTGPFIDLLAGSASGGTAVLCTYPLDLARTKLAYQVMDSYSSENPHSHPRHPRLRHIFRNVYREGGVRAFYRGIGPTLVGILPYAGLKYYIYEELKLKIPEDRQDSIVMRLSCGALAGLVGQTFTYPLDVVRRQMQAETAELGNARFKNTIEGLSNIVRNQGWRQLYAGLSINYIKVVPSVAIGFTAYDVLKSWMHYSNQQNAHHSSSSNAQN